MARKKTFASPPLAPVNQWVRNAFMFAEANNVSLSYAAVAEAMTRARIGGIYDKTMVQKMTTERGVSLAEAQVISQLTKYALPTPESQAVSLDDRLAKLSEARRRRMLDTLADLEAAEAVDRQAGSSGRGSMG